MIFLSVMYESQMWGDDFAVMCECCGDCSERDVRTSESKYRLVSELFLRSEQFSIALFGRFDHDGDDDRLTD